MPRQVFDFPLKDGSKAEINIMDNSQPSKKIEISVDDPLYQIISQLKDGKYQLPNSAVAAPKIDTAIIETDEVEEMSTTLKNSISDEEISREEKSPQEESCREDSDSDTFDHAARKVIRTKKRNFAAKATISEEETVISSANEPEQVSEKESDSDSSENQYVSKTLHLELLE